MKNHQKFIANSGFIMREIAGEVLLVPVGEQTRIFNGMVTLTETGAFIWKHLDGKHDVAELAKLLADECNESIDRILPDVEEFLEKAFENGLIIKKD